MKRPEKFEGTENGRPKVKEIWLCDDQEQATTLSQATGLYTLYAEAKADWWVKKCRSESPEVIYTWVWPKREKAVARKLAGPSIRVKMVPTDVVFDPARCIDLFGAKGAIEQARKLAVDYETDEEGQRRVRIEEYMEQHASDIAPKIDPRSAVKTWTAPQKALAAMRDIAARIAKGTDGQIYFITSENVLLDEESFERLVRNKCKDVFGEFPLERSLREALRELLVTRANMHETIRAHLRTMQQRENDHEVIYHMLRPDRFVKISGADEVKLIEKAPEHIYAGVTDSALPDPDLSVTSEDAQRLFSTLLANLTEANQMCFLTALNASLFQKESKNFIAINGEQGTGKTTLCDLFSMVHSGAPREHVSIEELQGDAQFSILRNRAVLVIDNDGRLGKRASDMMCKFATGTTLQRRKLYSTDVLACHAHRPIVINGKHVEWTLSDLTDRSITIETRSADEIRKLRSETTGFEAFVQARFPQILGAIFNGLNYALASSVQCIPTFITRNPEAMSAGAIAASWQLGCSIDSVVQALKSSRKERDEEVAESNELVCAIIEVAESLAAGSKTTGPESYANWIEAVRKKNEDYFRRFPMTGQTFANACLKTHGQDLKAAGWEAKRHRNNKMRQLELIRIVDPDQETLPL